MQISVRPNTYIYMVLLLFLVPLPWLLAWFIAVLVHEFCHWALVMLCGGTVESLTIGIGGVKMQSGVLSDGKQLLCILGGPLGGFALVMLGRWLPRTALCSWLLSVYNLLPLLPLDGGRVLQILFKNNTKYYIFERCFLVLLTVCAIYVSFFLHLGVLPVLITGILWLRNRKIPCKAGVCKVQ